MDFAVSANPKVKIKESKKNQKKTKKTVEHEVDGEISIVIDVLRIPP